MPAAAAAAAASVMPATSTSTSTSPVASRKSSSTVPEKKYKCQFCNRAFSRSEHRSRHERSREYSESNQLRMYIEDALHCTALCERSTTFQITTLADLLSSRHQGTSFQMPQMPQHLCPTRSAASTRSYGPCQRWRGTPPDRVQEARCSKELSHARVVKNRFGNGTGRFGSDGHHE